MKHFCGLKYNFKELTVYESAIRELFIYHHQVTTMRKFMGKQTAFVFSKNRKYRKAPEFHLEMKKPSLRFS